MDLDLKIDELLQILVELGGLGGHLVGKRDAGNLLGEKRPTSALDLGNFERLGSADAGLGDAGRGSGPRFNTSDAGLLALNTLAILSPRS